MTDFDNKPQYWLFGANWDGTDKTEMFVRRGYWEMGYDDDQKPDYAQLRDQMKEDDRIAIKSRGGKSAEHINIKAVGIVKEVDSEEGRVYVDWILSGIDREVPCRGKFSTIHPPLSEEHEGWIHSIFRI